MDRDQSLHLVLLNKFYPPWIGGIERHVQDIGEALVKRGWRVTALVSNHTHQERRETIQGVQVLRMPQWTRCFSQPIVPGYLRCLKELNPDLVHVHVPFPLGWWAGQAIGDDVPLICTWHSDIIRQRFLMPLLGTFQKRFLQRCNRILPTSQPLLDHSHDLQSFRDRCTVIPLALPATESLNEDEIQRHLHQYRERFPQKFVLFVGRLVQYKGLPYLIEAMKSLDAVLVLAGDGPCRKSLKRQVSDMGLESKIVFLGSVSEAEKTALYRSAWVTVLPSITRNEAFGYVLLEAMAQGCPVISTDLPTGTRFVNQQEVSGLVVLPANVQALAEALRRFMENADFRERVSQGALHRVRTVFDFDATIDQLEGVYRDALGAAGSRNSTPAR